jgi:hypothetical protein
MAAVTQGKKKRFRVLFLRFHRVASYYLNSYLHCTYSYLHCTYSYLHCTYSYYHSCSCTYTHALVLTLTHSYSLCTSQVGCRGCCGSVPPCQAAGRTGILRIRRLVRTEVRMYVHSCFSFCFFFEMKSTMNALCIAVPVFLFQFRVIESNVSSDRCASTSLHIHLSSLSFCSILFTSILS